MNGSLFILSFKKYCDWITIQIVLYLQQQRAVGTAAAPPPPLGIRSEVHINCFTSGPEVMFLFSHCFPITKNKRFFNITGKINPQLADEGHRRASLLSSGGRNSSYIVEVAARNWFPPPGLDWIVASLLVKLVELGQTGRGMFVLFCIFLSLMTIMLERDSLFLFSGQVQILGYLIFYLLRKFCTFILKHSVHLNVWMNKLYYWVNFC